MSDVDAVIGWLLEAPPGQLVEDCGATMLLAAISGTQITAVVHSHGSRQLTAGDGSSCRYRGMQLVTSGTGRSTRGPCPPQR